MGGGRGGRGSALLPGEGGFCERETQEDGLSGCQRQRVRLGESLSQTGCTRPTREDTPTQRDLFDFRKVQVTAILTKHLTARSADGRMSNRTPSKAPMGFATVPAMFAPEQGPAHPVFACVIRIPLETDSKGRLYQEQRVFLDPKGGELPLDLSGTTIYLPRTQDGRGTL